MDERDFVIKKRAAWERLRGLVARANRRGGVRGLSRDEIVSLGPLYRRASSDLAYVRAHAVNEDLIGQLNGLVGEAHALLYEAETSGNWARSIQRFYFYEFPSLLQHYARYFISALTITLLGAWIGYTMVRANPVNMSHFMPPGFEESVKRWKEGAVVDTSHVEFSSMLMTHNFQVGCMAFAAGVACGVPTVMALFINGGTVGALAAVVGNAHQLSLWSGILPHGIAELSAIFICGAGGLMMGVAILTPGEFTRSDAFRIAGRDAIRLVIGTIPMFIFAGIIEGMFSHLALAAAIRLTFAAANGIVWYLYLFVPRKEPSNVRSVTDSGTQFSPAA